MTVKQDMAEIQRRADELTPWTQRPGWVARVAEEVEHDRNKRLERENRLPQPTASPDQLRQLTGHLKDVLTEQGMEQLPRKVQNMLREYGAKACPSCLEVLDREAGFYSGDSECKRCAAERETEYREQNRETILQRRREAYAADPDKHRERSRQWVQEHREYVQSYRRDYLQRRPLVRKLNAGYHRAVKVGNRAERITVDQLESHWRSVGIDGTRCFYTGEPLDSSNISLDHATPLSRNGAHALDNLVPTTVKTNLDKGTRTAAEYLADRTPPKKGHCD